MNIKDLSFQYDKDFKPSADYLDNMPDLQNGDTIRGARTLIEKVGISNFNLPIKIKTKDGEVRETDVSVAGTVSLEAVKKGINMSRIIRSFYGFKDQVFDIDKLGEVLKQYQKDLDSFEAYILLSFKYRMWQESLRSVDKVGNKNGGWQYYNITLEGNIDDSGTFEKILHVDFVYSSACPCSTELSLYAMETRGTYAIPHSQRSVARVSVKFDEFVWIEDVLDMCREGLKTETLVFCKREDEMAFAELNASNVKFVEDAARLLFQQLNSNSLVKDFKVIISHNESLHSHDAIAVITKGIADGYDEHISVADLKSLIY